VFSEELGILGSDFDHCIVDGVLDPEVEGWVAKLTTRRRPRRCSLASFSELQRIQIDSQPGAVRAAAPRYQYPPSTRNT
jgi:hypothetical protein